MAVGKGCDIAGCSASCTFPRVLCDGQPCLPVGTSDLPGTSTVKIFCPKCEDIYYPRIDYQVGCVDREPVSWAPSSRGMGQEVVVVL